MKKILMLMFLFCGTVFAQNIPVSPSVPVGVMTFRSDSVNATDTNWVAFYAPYTMNVLAIQAVASATIDTGASGIGAGTFTLYKLGSAAAIVKDSITAVGVVKSVKPISSTVGKLTKGSIYKIKWELAANEAIRKLTLLLHYTQ